MLNNAKYKYSKTHTMSRTKKTFEAQVESNEQELQDLAEQMYQEEREFFEKGYDKETEDALPPPNSIWKSIAAFQSEVPILTQNTKGYNYTYVDLAEIVRVITPLLRKYNLAVIQPLEGDGYINTIVFHTITGEKLESKVKIPLAELDRMNIYQSYGSAISYFRRYSLTSFLGLISEKDTDASGTAKHKVKEEPFNKKAITNENLEVAFDMIKQGEFTIEKLINNYYFSETQQTIVAKFKKDAENQM